VPTFIKEFMMMTTTSCACTVIY